MVEQVGDRYVSEQASQENKQRKERHQKKEGKRCRVELALRDGANKTIGALSVGFRYQSGDGQKALLSKAEEVRDELQKRIPSLENLVELDP